jgi:hypothetical protein
MFRSSALRVRGAGQDTPDHPIQGLRLEVVWAIAVLAMASCATPRTETWTPENVRRAEQLEAQLAETAKPPDDSSFQVRLAFGADADLDLFVTDLDPRVSETVYFAKHKTRAGGRLLNDARCGDDLPRNDAVVYETPHTAGYRIGVDYHRSCRGRPEFTVFVVEWASGERVETRRGIARPGHFDDRFWMVDEGAIEGSRAPLNP